MFLLYFCGMAIIAILYVLFDANYFLKFFIIIIWARLFKRKKKLLDTTTFYGKLNLNQCKKNLINELFI